MSTDDLCPICFEEYGDKEDGSFLCKDGKDNSNFAEICAHYFCVKCISKLRESNICACCGELCTTTCPICREDWTDYLSHRTFSEDDEDREDDDNIGSCENKQ